MVGEYESNPAEGKISSVSPLGKALIGKKKGDTVQVEAPSGKISYEILQIK
ncbi:MAG: GreA/GreB family elongation factor [Microgenomates group bacterium]